MTVFAYLKSRVLSWRASPAMARHRGPDCATCPAGAGAGPRCLLRRYHHKLAAKISRATYAATRQALNASIQPAARAAGIGRVHHMSSKDPVPSCVGQ